jgi:hypothetical protein
MARVGGPSALAIGPITAASESKTARSSPASQICRKIGNAILTDYIPLLVAMPRPSSSSRHLDLYEPAGEAASNDLNADEGATGNDVARSLA